VLLFVGVGCRMWTVFVVHDTILGRHLGKPWWAVWRNALCSPSSGSAC
jgi:hypothetical protein